MCKCVNVLTYGKDKGLSANTSITSIFPVMRTFCRINNYEVLVLQIAKWFRFPFNALIRKTILFCINLSLMSVTKAYSL